MDSGQKGEMIREKERGWEDNWKGKGQVTMISSCCDEGFSQGFSEVKENNQRGWWAQATPYVFSASMAKYNVGAN